MASLYKAFLSYSHAADGKLAPALQRAVQRLGKPWYRRPVVRVFRDETSLSANPGLWSSIEHALEQCEYFLFLASVESAASPWVRREVAWWLEHRSIDRLLIIVTDGEIAWDQTASDFDWRRTTCLPPELRGRHREEPLYVDLRWARDRSDLSLRNLKFRAAVLTLAAPLHGQPMDELDSEDIRQQRRFKLVASGALVALGAMAAAVVWGLRSAREQASYAESRSMAAKSLEVLEQKGGVDKAILLGVLAWRLAPTDEALSSLQKIERASSDVARILGQHSIEQIDAMAFSPVSNDKPRLATGGVDGSIMLWVVPEGTAAGPPITSEQTRILEMHFSANGLYLLSRGSAKTSEEDDRRETIVLHDLRSRTSRVAATEFLIRKKWDIDQNMALSSDGHLVAFWSGDTIAVWDAKTDSTREKGVGVSGHLWGVHFTGNSRLIFVFATGPYVVQLSAGVWDLETDTIRTGPGIPASAVDSLNTSATFNHDGSEFVAWGYNGGHIDLYGIGDGMSLQRLQFPGNVRMQDDIRFHVAFGAGGRRVVVGGGGKIASWDLAEHRLLKEVKLSSSSDDPPVAISPDGRWFTTEDHGKVVVWDLDHPDSKAQGKTIDAACSLGGDRARECIRRLCEKVSPSINEKDLSDVLGSFDYQRLKQRALGEPCAHP